MDYDSIISRLEKELEFDFEDVPMSKENFVEWYQNKRDTVSDSNRVWLNTVVDIVSNVEEPAQDSEFIEVKSQDVEFEILQTKDFILNEDEKDSSEDNKNIEDRQIASAALLVPDEPDKEDDTIPRKVVVDSAYDFMMNIDEKQTNIDFDHSELTGKGQIVASWPLKSDREFETVDGDTKIYEKGTWFVDVKYFEEEDYERVQDGNVKGFSMQGPALSVNADKLMEVMDEELEEYEENTVGQDIKGQNNKNTNMANDNQDDTKDTEDENKADMEEVLDMIENMSDRIEDIEDTHEDLMEQMGTHYGMDEDEEDDEEDDKSESIDKDTEENKDEAPEDDPCEDGWEMVGMKPADDGEGMVPNCVPEEDAEVTKMIETEDIMGLVADHLDVEVSDVTEALDELVNGGDEEEAVDVTDDDNEDVDDSDEDDDANADAEQMSEDKGEEVDECVKEIMEDNPDMTESQAFAICKDQVEGKEDTEDEDKSETEDDTEEKSETTDEDKSIDRTVGGMFNKTVDDESEDEKKSEDDIDWDDMFKN